MDDLAMTYAELPFPAFFILNAFARDKFNLLKRWGLAFKAIFAIPHIRVNLMLDKTVGNDPFFERVTRGFYDNAVSRHPKFPLVGRMQYGVAACEVKRGPNWYFNLIEPAGRRNVKKALRLGYEFVPIDFNDYLDDVADIHKSTIVRQGRRIPDVMLKRPNPISNPPSTNSTHDYPYFGVVKDGRLVAYLSCLVAGEFCVIETIFGHAEYQDDGIVPLLLVSTGEALPARYPTVKYFVYGTYYGASETLQRFKKKFRFLPHRVTWLL